MPNMEMRGTVTEVKPCTIYAEGVEIPGFDITLHQAGYEAFCQENDWTYYPPRIRFAQSRLPEGREPLVGDKVVALVSAQADRGRGENADKTYCNLRGRRLSFEK